MKVIISEQDYAPVATGVEKIIDKQKMLPENIFRCDYRFFLFITFDELFMPLFYNHLKQYLLAVGEDSFWMTSVDPDPKNYFATNFDFYGAFEFFVSDTEDDYLAALNNYPEDSPADALVHSVTTLLFFSPRYGWAIYGHRDTDIAVCSFKDQEHMEMFKSTYGSDLLNGVKSAAEYAYGVNGLNELKDRFCSSYFADIYSD